MSNKTNTDHITTNDQLLSLLHQKRVNIWIIYILLFISTAIFLVSTLITPLNYSLSTYLTTIIICTTLLVIGDYLFNAILLLAAQLTIQSSMTDRTIITAVNDLKTTIVPTDDLK